MGSGFCAGHFLTHIGKCILYLAGKKDKIDITEKTVEEVMGSTFLSKIDIEKVRHLRNIEIPLEKTKRKHLILTGKNGSGKTSVLNAIAVEFQKQMVDADVEHKREDGKKADKPMPDWPIKDTEGNSYFVQMMKANQSQRLLKYVKQFNKIIKRSSTPIPYRIGFVNDKKMEDETELDAKDVKDLASLWKSLCKELGAEENSVSYVARA